MIFWLFVILFIVFLVLCVINDRTIESDLLGISSGVISGVSLVIAIVMLTFIIPQNLCATADKNLNQERYKALVYKAENKTTRDEFGVINKDYIDEIQYWNEDLAKNKSLEKDFWVGIFLPNIYDDFEFIDLNSIEYKTTAKTKGDK